MIRRTHKISASILNQLICSWNAVILKIRYCCQENSPKMPGYQVECFPVPYSRSGSMEIARHWCNRTRCNEGRVGMKVEMLLDIIANSQTITG